MKTFLTTFLLLLSLGLGGCGGGSGDGDSNLIDIGEELSTGGDGFTDEQRSFLYDLFLDEYLWYDHVTPGLDVSGYDDPNDMIDALKYDLLDQWSFAQTPEDYENWVNQSTSGFGCLFYYGSPTVTDVHIGSPCDIAGVRRGDTITHVNGEPLTPNDYNAAAAAEGVTTTLTVMRDGTPLNVDITASDYDYAVVDYQVFTRPDSTKVGHLIYNEFTSASMENLEHAFTYFKTENVTKLIIDLRYNGGGALATASNLLDFIAANAYSGQTQFTLQSNAKLNETYDYTFTDELESNFLDLDQVVFIGTEFTASASEAVINALEPYMDVEIIGATTHGKPVGMWGKAYGGYIYWLINFGVYNADGDGDYFNGLPVDCAADDDLTHLRTDGNESMLAEALYYIDNDGCSP